MSLCHDRGVQRWLALILEGAVLRSQQVPTYCSISCYTLPDSELL